MLMPLWTAERRGKQGFELYAKKPCSEATKNFIRISSLEKVYLRF